MSIRDLLERITLSYFHILEVIIIIQYKKKSLSGLGKDLICMAQEAGTTTFLYHTIGPLIKYYVIKLVSN